MNKKPYCWVQYLVRDERSAVTTDVLVTCTGDVICRSVATTLAPWIDYCNSLSTQQIHPHIHTALCLTSQLFHKINWTTRLQGSRRILTICSAILTRYRSVTGTNGQMYRIAINHTTSQDKNYSPHDSSTGTFCCNKKKQLTQKIISNITMIGVKSQLSSSLVLHTHSRPTTDYITPLYRRATSERLYLCTGKHSTRHDWD